MTLVSNNTDEVEFIDTVLKINIAVCTLQSHKFDLNLIGD
jgi:hypothetical protein